MIFCVKRLLNDNIIEIMEDEYAYFLIKTKKGD